jgi:small subunit ribosomal protein S16
MLAIRFARVGRKNKAQFKVVLQQHTVAPGGRHIAILGSYDPAKKIAVLKADKIKEWISKGAQASNSAYNLFVKEGIIEGKKRAIKMAKPKKTEAPEAEAPKAEPKEAKAEEAKTEKAETPKVEKAEEPKEQAKEEPKEEPKEEAKEEPKEAPAKTE